MTAEPFLGQDLCKKQRHVNHSRVSLWLPFLPALGPTAWGAEVQARALLVPILLPRALASSRWRLQ